MIIVFIFLLHIIFVGYVFIKKLKKDSLSSAFINLAFIIIFFSVGWSLSGMLVKLIFEPEGFGIYFDRDTIALTILTIAEFFFFKIYYKDINSTSA
ncbi:MAG: hypothetical protein WAR79_00885 [Melioribacteraceae bacterium]